MALILASQSPRRQELLRRMGLTDFRILVPQAEEVCPAGLSPQQTVEHISRVKALAVQPSVSAEDTVITADTMVFLDEQRLGKPRDEEEALAMLRALQGRSHCVCTGVSVMRHGEICTQSELTRVFFRSATDEELRGYIATGEPMDKAGAYGVQGLGALLVERIEGDFFNVMGLPMLRLSRMLQRHGFHFFQQD